MRNSCSSYANLLCVCELQFRFCENVVLASLSTSSPPLMSASSLSRLITSLYTYLLDAKYATVRVAAMEVILSLLKRKEGLKNLIFSYVHFHS